MTWTIIVSIAYQTNHASCVNRNTTSVPAGQTSVCYCRPQTTSNARSGYLLNSRSLFERVARAAQRTVSRRVELAMYSRVSRTSASVDLLRLKGAPLAVFRDKCSRATRAQLSKYGRRHAVASATLHRTIVFVFHMHAEPSVRATFSSARLSLSTARLIRCRFRCG